MIENDTRDEHELQVRTGHVLLIHLFRHTTHRFASHTIVSAISCA
jgi:hypothetical protein